MCEYARARARRGGSGAAHRRRRVAGGEARGEVPRCRCGSEQRRLRREHEVRWGGPRRRGRMPLPAPAKLGAGEAKAAGLELGAMEAAGYEWSLPRGVIPVRLLTQRAKCRVQFTRISHDMMCPGPSGSHLAHTATLSISLGTVFAATKQHIKKLQRLHLLQIARGERFPVFPTAA